MGAEYINPQWRLPNYKTGNNQGYSVDFNGTNQYITLGSISSINTDFTVSGWINTTQTGLSGSAYRGWFSTGTFNNVGQFAISVSNSSSHGGVGFVNVWEQNQLRIAGTSNVSDGNWHHVVLVKTSAQLEIYVNGSLQNTASNTTTFTFPTAYIGIGAGGAGAGNQGRWDGKISQVCVFNYALSSSQVTTLWGGGTAVSNPMALPSPPIAYYPLGNSAHTGSNYLTPNNAVQDYVFFNNGYPKKIEMHLGSTFNNNMSELSVAMWIKKTDTTRTKDYTILQKIGAPLPTSFNIFFKRDQYASSGTNLAFHINTGTVQKVGGETVTGNGVALTIDNDVWYHVVGTYDGTTQSLYINGNLHDYKSTSGNITGVSEQMILGGGYGGAGSSIYFVGEYSNVQLFDKGLTATDVATLYNYGSPIKTLANIPQSSNLKAWYKLDASEVYDSSNTQWQIANNVLSDKAYSFNGTNNIEIAQNSSIQTSNFSIGLWIKGYPQLDKTIIENGGVNGFSIKTKHNDGTKVLINTGGINGLELTGALNGEWNFVYFTMSGSISRGGLNGGYSNAGGAARNYDSSKGLFIGSKSDSTSGFTGEIAQVVYYDERGPNNAGSLYGNLPANPPPTGYAFGGSGSTNPNLVSWWKLDAASITDSQGSNNGTNNGATLIDTNVGRPAGIGGLSSGMTQANLVQSDLQTVAPYSKYAMNFDGANDYIQTSSHPIDFTTGNFTCSAWINVANVSNHQGIFGIRNSTSTALQFYVRNNNELYSWNGSTDVTSTSTITNDVWNHVVLVQNGSNKEFYINGVLDNTVAQGNGSTSAATFKIGYTGYGAEYLNGSISNCSIWNTALTQTQVTELYNEGLPSNLNSHSAYSNLVSWWQLGENSSYASGWTCVDEKGSSNGTSYNMLENAIVNGVGTSGNGTSANMGTATNISGDSPNGEGNSLSVNMTTANLTTGVV